jgi:hypothetical protein
MSDVSIALLGLIGAAMGAVPGILGAVIPWLRNKDNVARAMRDRELALKEIEFVSAWHKAMSDILPEEDLKSLKAEARSRLNALLLFNKPPTELIESPKSPETQMKPAKKGRMMFFTYLGFYVFMMFGASIDDDSKSSFSYLISKITTESGAFMFGILSIILVILFLRWFLSGRPKAQAR